MSTVHLISRVLSIPTTWWSPWTSVRWFLYLKHHL
jgi:uncharacterized membrane protein YwzB